MPREAIRDFQARRDRGEVTAQAFVESCLAEIAARNPQAHAFVCIDADGARAAAGAPTSAGAAGLRSGRSTASAGDQDNIDVAGLPAAAGIAALRERTPRYDAACIARLRARGAVLLGRRSWTRRRWGQSVTTLRSAAAKCARARYTAAVRAADRRRRRRGLCAAALGTDTLGSVRIPASYCGIVGFVPSKASSMQPA